MTSRARVLVLSRRVGWVLAAGMVAGWVVAGFELRAYVQRHEALGRSEARSFINAVIACRRNSPRPHPSWDECERRVRGSD